MKPPTERQLIKWWDARIAAYRAEQGVESPILTCADCGRRDHHAYVQPQHPYWTDGREDVARCGDCLNAIINRKRAERRVELAGRPRDCQRCMARPHTFTWGPYRLCGRCLTASKRRARTGASQRRAAGHLRDRPARGHAGVGRSATAAHPDRGGCAMKDHWLNESDLPALVARDRLCPVLVRYRGASEGRFTAPAQDAGDLIRMLRATGRYPRDISTTEREQGPAGWRSTT